MNTCGNCQHFNEELSECNLFRIEDIYPAPVSEDDVQCTEWEKKDA
jgi:hypothetical protein